MLAAVLAALLAYELPHLLERSSGNSSAAVPAAPAAATPTTRVEAALAGRGTAPIRSRAKSLPNGDAHAVSGGGPDPFTASPAIFVVVRREHAGSRSRSRS